MSSWLSDAWEAVNEGAAVIVALPVAAASDALNGVLTGFDLVNDQLRENFGFSAYNGRAALYDFTSEAEGMALQTTLNRPVRTASLVGKAVESGVASIIASPLALADLVNSGVNYGLSAVGIDYRFYTNGFDDATNWIEENYFAAGKRLLGVSESTIRVIPETNNESVMVGLAEGTTIAATMLVPIGAVAQASNTASRGGSILTHAKELFVTTDRISGSAMPVVITGFATLETTGAINEGIADVAAQQEIYGQSLAKSGLSSVTP